MVDSGQPNYEPPAPQQVVYVEQKKKGGALKWLAIIGGLMVLLLGGCMALLVVAAGDVQEELDKQQELRQSDEQLVEANARITRCAVADFGTGEVDVEFTNPLDEEKGYISIEINFFDSDNVVVGDALVTFENLGSGQRARATGTAFNLADGASNVRCEVVDGTIL